MKLPQLPLDKANHFVYGTGVYAVVKLLTGNKEYAFLAAVAASVVKEVIDKTTNKGKPELMDAVATVVPGIMLYIGDQ